MKMGSTLKIIEGNVEIDCIKENLIALDLV